MFLITTDTLSAFETAAGISPAKLSFLIRTILLTLTFIWAAWCVLGEIHQLRHGDLDIHHSSQKILRILLVVALMMILVFI